MSKKFLIFAATLLVLGGIVLVLIGTNFLSNPKVQITDQDRINARKAMDGNAGSEQAAVQERLDPSRMVRMAVGSIGLSNDEANKRVGDLIVAELTGARGLELVERQSLDEVLRELDLSLTGLVRAQDAMRVGKILRVDWFLLGTLSVSSTGRAVVVRLVDAHSGIMRNLDVIPWDEDGLKLSRELAAFARRSREAASALRPTVPVFLAIGAFADVSINDRQANLGRTLRAGLTGAYQNGDFTLLEREHLETLLQEVGLDLAGLTDDSSNSRAPMQSAMWLVNGYYQSLETTGLEIELVLRAHQIFGRTRTETLRANSSEALIGKVKNSLDTIIAKARSSPTVPSRVSEAKAQMAAGKELASVNTTDRLNDRAILYSLNIPRSLRDVGNVEEAIRAFQTVLLLEPENRVARMYAASLFRESSIGKVDQARAYYREIIAMPEKDQWTTNAMRALANSYEWEDPEEAVRWYQAAGAPLEARDVLARNGGDTDKAAAIDAKLIEGTRTALEGALSKHGYFNAAWGMLNLVIPYGTNYAGAASALNAQIPKLLEMFPILAPHLLASAIQFQVDTNASIIVDFHRSLKASIEHPESLTNAPRYFESMLEENTFNWCMKHGLYSLAVEIVEGKLHAASKGYATPLTEQERVMQAFAYRYVGRMKEALEIFESLHNKPIDMEESGPWQPDPFLPPIAVKECRKELGLQVSRDPIEFDLGPPCLHLHGNGALVGDGSHLTNRSWSKMTVVYDQASFGVDGKDLWAARGTNLFQLDLALNTNLVIPLPKNSRSQFNSLCVGGEKIWIAANGEGLIEFNKSTHKVRKLETEDGLLLNTIRCLLLQGESLWIGYGGTRVFSERRAGGLGLFDLRSQRFSSFTPALSIQGAESQIDPMDGPPRSDVVGIAASSQGDLWLLLGKREMKKYSRAQKTWSTLTYNKTMPACVLVSDEHLFVGYDIAERNYKRTNEVSTIPGRSIAGVEIQNLRNGSSRRLSLAQGLPAPQVSALALDGSDLWIGGRGYVAVVDLHANKVRKVCYVNTRAVDRIQIASGYAWVQFGGHLYRVLLQDVR